jgi:threonine dehydrogenase-like Zn-dependent dehydrogenase
VPLPTALDGQPVPGEALACAWNVFQRSGLEAGQAVAVVGIGFLGALLVEIAARAGARVIAVSRRPFALEVARRMGAESVLSLAPGRDLVPAVAERAGPQLCDVVIEATGLQEPLTAAGAPTPAGGRGGKRRPSPAAAPAGGRARGGRPRRGG